MNLEENIRKIVCEEIDKRQQKSDFVPIEEFCKTKGISRSTIWRREKEGIVNLTRIGKKVYINPHQFV